MKLKEIYKSAKPAVSFEVFPPKMTETVDREQKIQALLDELRVLSKYKPAFISVTYGAGGSTQETTFDVVLKIKDMLSIPPMPHFTCVGSARDEILDYIKKFEQCGIENILALRGDPPKGQEHFVKPKDGFGYASELVEFIKTHTNLGIGVAGYPECHQECCSLDVDIQNLGRKVDCGAEAIITQLFYDNRCYFDFVEKARAQGIAVPVVPGILPITSYSQLDRIVTMSGCALPQKFRDNLERHKDDAEAIKEIGLGFAVGQCRELLAGGVPGLHFYTLNRAYAVGKVLDELKINECDEYINA
jgi:methylenetetrahydrofolate reductase (NADPH)